MKRKVHRFGFVLTDDEKQALARLAEIEGGLSEAATVRRLIRRAANERGVWPLADLPRTRSCVPAGSIVE